MESPQAIREQLDRITSSHAFQQVDRLKRFLIFVVEESVSGRADRLKEFVIGAEVFEKDSSFDPRTDPIVRVQARRLRARLARYYQEEGVEDRLVIELPRGGYSPSFHRLDAPPPRRTLSVVLASRNTIAVLPFADHSQSQELGYFCQGLRQELAHQLVACEGLRVVHWDPSLALVSSQKEAASKLDVAMLVAGSVRKSGSKVRINAELIDASSGCFLYSESFDRIIKDPFDVQSEIARAVVNKVSSSIAPGIGSAGIKRRSRENLAARNLYVQGRYHIEQRTEDGLRKAVDLFERAIAEDGQYAQAYSGLSDAWVLLGHYSVVPPVEVWNRAASNAATAVMLDPESAEAHASLAHAKSTQDWDWAGAESEYKRALTLDPRYSTARHWYAISCLAPTGRLEEALQEIATAQAIDPTSSIIARDYAAIRCYAGDAEGALEQIDLTIALNPYFPPAYATLGTIQEQRGDFEEALAAFQRAVQLSPSSPRMQSGLARIFAITGKTREAERIRAELLKLSVSRYVSPFEFALMSFALGETGQGFDWLTKAFQNRCFEILLLRVDPRFHPYRQDPRFQGLDRQLGLPAPSRPVSAGGLAV